MGRKSGIDLLGDEFRAALQALLRDPRVSQLDATLRVNTLLEEAGREERVSKSAVNRYAVRMEEVGAKLRQSREVAEMWIGKLGSAPAGQVGHLLNEVVRNLAFDTAIQLAEGEEPVEPKLIKELAIAIEKLERASSEGEKRAEQVLQREQARAKAKLDEMETSAKTGRGKFDPETLRRVREEVYGLV